MQFKVETFLGDLQAGKVPYDDISSTSVPDTSRYPPKNKSDQGRYHLYIARFAHRIRPILDAAHVQGELPKILTGPHEQDASRVLFDSTPNRWEVEDLMRCVFIWHTFKRKNRPALKKLRGEYLDAEKQEAAKAESSKSKPAAHDPMFDQVMADAAKDDRVMHAAREHHLAAQAIIKKNKEQKPSTDDAAVKVKRRRGQNEARTWDLHFYKDMPELPIWFNPQASIVMSAEDEAAIRESLENLHSRQRVTELMQQWYEQTDLDVDPEEMARHTNDLVGAADFAKVVQGVAKLSDPVAQGLLTALGDGVEVLFDNNRKIDRFAAHGKATASFRSAAQAEADDMEALADGNPDWHKLTQAEKDALHERYLQHNVFLNRKSACPPPFREACRAIGVTVTDLPAGETDPITGASIRLELEGLRLKVWQPQAIAYMAFALTSPMRACILADGVGVGKTVMALATAAHMQKAQVAKQEAWEAAVQERVEHYRATEPEALGLATREEIIAGKHTAFPDTKPNSGARVRIRLAANPGP